MARSLVSAALIGSCIILASCSTPGPSRSRIPANDAPVPRPRQVHLLYLLPSPCPRLHVEVDAVEGCVPSDVRLARLRDFLSTYCQKPEGIDIVRSDVISRKSARGFSAQALARRYIDGPPTNNASAAFMYVIFYNSALRKAPPAGKVPVPTPAAFGIYRRIAYTDVGTYPAIYYDNRGPRDPAILLHESGHMLGLVRRQHGRVHCPDRNCLMYGRRSIIPMLLLGRRAPIRQQRLCERCIAELNESLAHPPLRNIRYEGAVLVRAEPGYYALSLPNRVQLLLRDTDGQHESDLIEACREFASNVRAEQFEGEEEPELGISAPQELGDPLNLAQVVQSLKLDPFPVVRWTVSEYLIPAFVEVYASNGQYSNAITLLDEAIRFDATDESSYNQLAWIKATSPDPSARNGTEAIAAGTKACELSEWSDGEWISTLAAAYAESGDFKRAIEFQERAIRTGNPAEPDQKEMRDRLLLYNKSQPVRWKQ